MYPLQRFFCLGILFSFGFCLSAQDQAPSEPPSQTDERGGVELSKSKESQGQEKEETVEKPSSGEQSIPTFEPDKPAVFNPQGTPLPPKKPKTVEEPAFEFKGKTLDEQKEEFKKKQTGPNKDIVLFFEPQKNGVEFPNQIIDYDLTLGNLLKVGPLNLPGTAIQVNLTREASYKSSLLASDSSVTSTYLLGFSWPLGYLSSGKIELVDDKNTTQWSQEITDREVWEWQHQLLNRLPHKERVQREKRLEEYEFWAKLSQQEPRKAEGGQKAFHSSQRNSSFGFLGDDFTKIPLKVLEKPFRFCLSKDVAGGHTAFCSRRYKVSRRSGKLMIRASSKRVRPKVFVNDRQVTLKGRAVFADAKGTLKFSAVLADGSYYEFVSSPKPINILDMVYDREADEVVVVGFGNPPMGQVEVIRRESPDFWDFLNFMPTIGDFRNFWRARFDANKPFLYLRGVGGAPFKQEFYYDELPDSQSRLVLDSGSKSSTYGRIYRLKGKKSKQKIKVKSKAKRARSKKNGDFYWDFLSKKRGQFNRSQILVKDGKHVWKSYYEMYRGYPREVSLRATGVVSSEPSLILLAEGAGQFWFEDLFGWESEAWSKQRWGLSTRYFQSMSSVDLGSEETSEEEESSAAEVDISVFNLDLKYRLSPGVWARDPTVGLVLGTQYIRNSTYSVTMFGGGAFWARSMPRLFDRLFNIIPFLRYPKWVNMEFLWYPLTFDAGKRIVLSFAMNFHGKVQWSDRLYGEAGFGVKYFSWQEDGKNIPVGLAYGTVGLGYNF